MSFSSSPHGAGGLFSRDTPSLTQRVHEQIARHRADSHFGAPQLAATLGLSETRLSRELRELGQPSPGKLIREYRLGHACHLLRNTDIPVKAVGLEIGYREPAHFCRSFQRTYHCSPGTYREAHQLAELVAIPAGLQQVPMPPETLTELQPLLQQEPWLRTTLHAVLDNLDQEGFDTQALAEETHMTVTQLQRRLKQTVDLSPARLIRQLRLQYALDLLHQGQDNLGTIAHKAGFFDQAHFSRAFKAQLQLAPKVYRLQHQNGTLWSGMIEKMRQNLKQD